MINYYFKSEINKLTVAVQIGRTRIIHIFGNNSNVVNKI